MLVLEECKNKLSDAVDKLPKEKVAELVDFAEFLCGKAQKPKQKKPRKLGLHKGEITIHPSFYEPLPDDIMKAFHGEES